MPGFLGGYSYHYNPYAQAPMQDVYNAGNQIWDKRSAGNRFANWWLRALMGKNGQDPGMLLNFDPMKGQYAQQLQDVERSTRQNMAFEGGAQPVLMNRNIQLAQDRTRQSQNASREGWLMGMTGQAMGLSENAQQARNAALLQSRESVLRGALGSESQEQEQGWGGLALQALFGGAQAAAGFRKPG